jgi:hypothetical protein
VLSAADFGFLDHLARFTRVFLSLQNSMLPSCLFPINIFSRAACFLLRFVLPHHSNTRLQISWKHWYYFLLRLIQGILWRLYGAFFVVECAAANT